MKSVKRNISIGLISSLAISLVSNCVSLFRRATCFDCSFPRGVPFTLYFDPTFNRFDGKGDILWTGVLLDIGFVLISGAGLGWILNRVRQGRRSPVKD